jgi:hypothetical protein
MRYRIIPNSVLAVLDDFDCVLESFKLLQYASAKYFAVAKCIDFAKILTNPINTPVPDCLPPADEVAFDGSDFIYFQVTFKGLELKLTDRFMNLVQAGASVLSVSTVFIQDLFKLRSKRLARLGKHFQTMVSQLFGINGVYELDLLCQFLYITNYDLENDTYTFIINYPINGYLYEISFDYDIHTALIEETVKVEV